MQDEVFPDEDDFGRIFRNNAVLSAARHSAVCRDHGQLRRRRSLSAGALRHRLMTEGSGLYLAGPALVKAAIGQEISHEELGGAHVHAAISGTIDYHENDDDACLARLRRLIGFLPPDPVGIGEPSNHRAAGPAGRRSLQAGAAPTRRPSTTCATCSRRSWTAAGSTNIAAEYGRTLVCGFGSLGGNAAGDRGEPAAPVPARGGGPIQFGGVIYADSADKAARFVLDCNQSRLPILFIQDVNGFDVGRDAERTGIIRRGAKLVNAVSNSTVPKITLIVGHSFGAGHYALCGKAFDPRFIFAWPGARYAVMGAQQAARTMLDVNVGTLNAQGKADRRRRASRRWPKSCASATTARPTSATPPRGSGSTRSSTRRRRARCSDARRSTWQCDSASCRADLRRVCFRCDCDS